jgi:hypothetical protein
MNPRTPRKSTIRFSAPALALALLLPLTASSAHAQISGLPLPPDGDNQFSSVTQGIGPARVTLTYNSPDVHGPKGEDRAGKIWGELVPYGMSNLGFGTCGDQCPWRGGANENTTFSTSHDLKVQGSTLKAGTYGLHFLPGKEEWTIIFSQTKDAWGSFFYDAKDDILRVQAKPEKSEYHEWLTYEFTDRQPDKATVALMWENLKVPFNLSLDNVADLYVDGIRRSLRNTPGFSWQNWVAAAQYTLQSKSHLAEGLAWAEAASQPPIGEENFNTLSALAQLQEVNGKAGEAAKTMDKAMALPTATAADLHQYGRQLLVLGKKAEAVKVFELNAKRHPGEWPTPVGLARALSAQGKIKEALEVAKAGLKLAPNDQARAGLEALVKTLEQGKDIN